MQLPSPTDTDRSTAAPSPWVCALALVACVLAVYLPSLGCGFVWDDTALVLRDPLIRSPWLVGEAFRHFLFLDATGSSFYRPIQRLTYLWDYAWFGFEPTGWHATSLVTHAAATIALHTYARRLFAAWALPPLAAFAAALIWAVHPVHSSAVIYVAGRADPLAALFGFLALIAGFPARDRPAALPGWHLAVVGLCLALAAFSKESGLMFGPLWLMLLMALRMGRRAGLQASVTVGSVWLIYALMRSLAHSTPTPPRELEGLAERLNLSVQAVAEYVGLALFPLRLSMERDLRLAEGAALRLAGGIAVLGGLLYVWARTRRHAGFGASRWLALQAALAYLPVSGLLPLNANCAEHWIYVPFAFALLSLAAALVQIRARAPSAWAAAAVLLCSIALGVRTWLRNDDWKDPTTFAIRTLATADATARMRMNLAGQEFRAGRREFAIELQRAVLRDHPELAAGRVALAGMLIAAGRGAEALIELDRVADVAWLQPESLELRAVEAINRRNLAEAETWLLQAATAAPSSWSIQRRLIRVVALREGPASAARRLGDWMHGPGGDFRAESWQMLAMLADDAGRTDLARRAEREAMRRDIRLSEHTAPSL